MTDAQRTNLRKILLIGVPLAVILIGGIIYLTGGRYESTDNAYVKSNKVMLSPEISGTVAQKLVDNNQTVTKGATLIVIDPQPFEIALARANAELATTRAGIEKLKAEYSQKVEELKMAASDADLENAEYDRAASLAKTGAMSQSKLDEATRNRDNAQAQMVLLDRELGGLRAELDGDPNIKPEDHSSYKSAAAMADKAQLDLTHTKIIAPADGIIGNVPNPGDYARASVPAMSLVETSKIWVEANFKETQIEHIKPGQKVEIDVDTYSGKTWEGIVESVAPATGSEFSILPAQNATGNWVKVVQRIAVRIKLSGEEASNLLRPGMSAQAKIDLKS